MKQAAETYLVRNIHHLDRVIKQLAILLPDRQFYQPEIYEAPFVADREQLKTMAAKLHSFAYRGDKQLQARYYQLLSSYQDRLDELVRSKRQIWEETLLEADLEIKAALLLLTLSQHEYLLKRLKTYN